MLSNTQIATYLNQGKVGIIPTDTVYGLVCEASNPDAVTRLYALKSRNTKPGTIIAASIEQFVALGIPRRYMTAVEHYWPNPISVIIPANQNLTYIHQGKGSLAIRIPNDARICDLLAETGPLLTTSANKPGSPPANTVTEAKAYFGDTVDFYVDGGDLSDHQASTIIRVIDDAVEVIRVGAIAIAEDGQIVSSA